MVRALFDQVATPRQLQPLGLVEVLDLAAAAPTPYHQRRSLLPSVRVGSAGFSPSPVDAASCRVSAVRRTGSRVYRLSFRLRRSECGL